MATIKPRLVSGDTPTGDLHLGHLVGSLLDRIALQKSYECFFILANTHAFITHAQRPQDIREYTLGIALDYLASGVDPKLSTLLIQSEIPAIAELCFYFSMLLPFSRVLRNPTLKSEIRLKNLGDHYPFGFLLYPVGQIADILAFRPEIVPVGEDQLPHLEMARECARRFNHLYCGVDPQTADGDQIHQGGLFPIIQAKVGRVGRLVGIGPPNADGNLPKMSKSLNNAILLSDSPEIIQKKVMQMYTDPKRIRTTDPGTTENNPLWIFHEAFNPDQAWVKQAMEQYRAGTISDVACKQKLIEVLVDLTEPMHQRRRIYASDPHAVLTILKEGTQHAAQIAQETLKEAKKYMRQDFF